MARRLIDQHTYDLLLSAYRERPGNHTNAARVAACDRRMAKRAWESGWEKAPWATPIKGALEGEQLSARAERARSRTEEFLVHQNERDAARMDAIESRAQELQGLKMARGASLAMFNSLLRVIRDVQPIADRVRAMTDDIENVSPERALATLERVSRIAATATNTAQTVMRMERLHAGEPEAVLGIAMADLTSDDITAELAEIESALRLAGADADEEFIEAVTVEE